MPYSAQHVAGLRSTRATRNDRDAAPPRGETPGSYSVSAWARRIQLPGSIVTPLSALLFAGLTLAWIATASRTPGSRATGANVAAFYEVHRHSQRIGDVLGTLGIVCFLVFAGGLRSYLRQQRRTDAAGGVMLAAASVLAVGLALFTGIDYALADAPGRLGPGAAQALNLLNQDLFGPAVVGAAVFALASGVSILRSRLLPTWVGAAALLIGVIALTPAARIAFLALIGWAIITAAAIHFDTVHASHRTGPTGTPLAEK